MGNWRFLIPLFVLTVVIAARDDARPRRTTEAEAIAAMEKELDRATAADEFSGTVIVAKKGQPIFAKTYNRSDRGRDLPNTLDTSFNVGSITKMFTAVTIMRLVQDGKLALTDTVGKWIPNYPNRDVADRVTIHHLLTHTGGTGDIFDDDWLDYRLTLRTHDDYVAKFGERGLLHEPGARFQYSNYGFVLAGAIIERATGMSYYDAVAKYVYAPAGMTGTSSPIHDELTPINAVGYTRFRNGDLEDNQFVLPYRGMAAGGCYSTTKDLLAFANALSSHALLDEKHTKLVTSPKVRTRFGFKYAYGFAELYIDGVRCIGHNGGFPGVNGELMFCDNGYTISILANFDPPAASRIGNIVLRKLPR